MSTLVVLLPSRSRHAAALAPGLTCAWWLLGADAQVRRQGHGAPDQWPRGERTVAVLDAAEISWHRLKLPRVARARLPQALAGALEDRLLDDGARAHFAVQPSAQAGAACWVAVFDGPWMRERLQAMAQAGIAVSHLVPLWAPTADERRGHFDTAGEAGQGEVRFTLSGPDGVVCLPLAGSALPHLARARAEADAKPPPAPVNWSATPAAVQAAEKALGRPVSVWSAQDLAAAAFASPWNLLQFDLAPRRGAGRWLSERWQQARTPRWRPLRWGVAALALVQVTGLGAAAWLLERDLVQRRAQQAALMRETFPQVSVVMNAPLQMRREVERLREAAGLPEAAGFERALETAAAAWPAGQPPAQRIEFERGRLTLGVPGWTDAQRAAFALALRGSGWSAQTSGDGLVLAADTAAGGAPSRP